jgi:hypothetical protein
LRNTLPHFMHTDYSTNVLPCMHAEAVDEMFGVRRGPIAATNPNNVTVTRLPYKGERKCLKFDNRVALRFKRKGSLSRELSGGPLAFTDFQRGMHMQHRCTACEMRLMYTPAFAANDEQVRLVLAQQCYSYACQALPGMTHGRVPDELVNDREKLEALTKRAVDAQHKFDDRTDEHATHLDWMDRNGGYLKLRSTVQHRAWRMYHDCVTIAEALGLTPPGVRQILQRLVITGRRLGLETFPPHHSYRIAIPADLAVGERPANWVGGWGPECKMQSRWHGKKSKRREQAAEELALLPGRPWIQIISRA